MLFLALLACTRSSPSPYGGATSGTQDGGATSEVGPLDGLLAEVIGDHPVPALAGAAIDRTGLVASGATGMRQRGGDVPVTVDDRWHLGSDTKAMTATLLALAVDRGQLSWDTTVPEAFAEIAVDPGWDTVTLEQLMQHRGGADDNLAVDHPEIWSGLWARADGCSAREWFTEQLLADPPTQRLGRYAYSNAGYMLIGAALEQATGTCWQDQMRSELFEPLGMVACGFGAPTGDQPWGHADSGGGDLVPVDPEGGAADNPPGLGPAGTVHCSLSDWAAFVGLHLAAAQGDPRLVSAEGFTRLHTPHESYAGGWVVGSTRRGSYLAHAGSNNMWFAWAVIEPERGWAWLTVANAGSDDAWQAVADLQLGLVERFD